MKAIVKQTKRLTIISFDFKSYTTNNDFNNNDFKERELRPEDIIGGIEVEGKNLQDIYQNFLIPVKAEYQAKKDKKDEIRVKNETILNNTKEHTPKEIWQAVKWAASQGWGWRATDILIADNSLSKQLANKLHAYTVAAYDDNSIMIKAGNKRYGTLRKWQSVEDLL